MKKCVKILVGWKFSIGKPRNDEDSKKIKPETIVLHKETNLNKIEAYSRSESRFSLSINKEEF